jgi:GT2 family glycosyltransferase
VKWCFLLVNFNMAGLVRNVVRNISLQFERSSQYEILIADNSCEECGRLTPSSLPEGIPARLFPIENTGFVDALNYLIPLTNAEYVTILHPDVELAPGCVAALTTFMEKHPKAGVVGPDLYYPDGSPNKIRLRFPTVASEAKRVANKLSHIVTRRKPLGDEALWDRRSDVSVQTVMSVCMLFRGAVLQQASPIDRHLITYYANDFLCWRVKQLGLTCHYTLAARAVHYERFSPRQHYADSKAMEYKRSGIAANPRMRTDYFRLNSLRCSLGGRLMLRSFALFDDALQLAAQVNRAREGRQDVRALVESIGIDLGRGARRPSNAEGCRLAL